MTDRKTWTPTDVVDVSGPPALVRNYLEQRDVRRYLQRAANGRTLQRAFDIGCGFGRLTPVLAEVATDAVGFEREASLVATARQLLPALTFTEVASLDALPAADRSAQFVMTFTVLQHMADSLAERVLIEMRRVATTDGHVLLCEETDPTLEAGDASVADLGYTRGRSIEWYAVRLEPFTLVDTAPRIIEPGYPRADVGTFMFFRGR
jgi:SAM-dependent methyltransferase